MKRPYTIVDAYHEEIAKWRGATDAERAVLMAFTYCLKLRLEGTSFERLFPSEPQPDYRAD